MGKLNVSVNDEIDKEFREEVFRRKGMKKGNIKEAVEEAMSLWVTETNNIKKEKKQL